MQKQPAYENRKLLDLAYKIEYCVNCGAPGCMPCHSNLSRHGKGRGLKAHDNQHFAGCQACHDWYDGRDGKMIDPTGIYGRNRQELTEFFYEMRDRTELIYWENGWIKVS